MTSTGEFGLILAFFDADVDLAKELLLSAEAGAGDACQNLSADDAVLRGVPGSVFTGCFLDSSGLPLAANLSASILSGVHSVFSYM